MVTYTRRPEMDGYQKPLPFGRQVFNYPVFKLSFTEFEYASEKLDGDDSLIIIIKMG